jgi:hypothetical protein
LERIEILSGAPTNVVMFSLGQGEGMGFGTSPIDHADVFVGIRDTVDIEKTWGDQGACARARGWWALADEFNVKAAFLLGFTNGGDLRIFIKFNVAAEWEPGIEFAMVNHKDFALVNDEDRDGEIYLFVDMRHIKQPETVA